MSVTFMQLDGLLTRHARHRPEHIALVFDEHRISYGELDRRVNRLANALQREGLGRGDKIATLLPNCVELLELYWACAKTGTVVVPLSPLLQPQALGALLWDADARALFTSAELARVVEHVRGGLPDIPGDRYVVTGTEHATGFRSYAEFIEGVSDQETSAAGIVDADPFNIIYSSGTTGDPKGIVHTHYVRAMYGVLFAAAWRMRPESVVLHTGSIVFNGAFVTLMPALFLGATYVLHRAFDPEAFVATAAREGVTHVMLVPSQIVALLNSAAFSPERLSSLEMILSLGAPLHREHKQRLNALLPDRLYELYGLTEGFVTILDKTDFGKKPDSVGAPPPFFEMRILDDDGRRLPPGEVGEIVGRGPILMPGYYNRPDMSARAVVDGWLHTGDLGYEDEDGYLYLVDRKKDLIISGGVNVYPRDIEEVAIQHPAVREVAVFGATDDKWGEAPIAAVILQSDAAVRAEEMKAWINAHVSAKYQRVREVMLVEDFPRNVAGKTLKRVLRERYEEN